MFAGLLSSTALLQQQPNAGPVVAVVCLAAVASLIRNLFATRSIDRKLAAMEVREAALEEAVITDAVTGLRNRVAFSRNLESLIARGGSEDVAVLFLDFDRFKEVNDTLGHKVGDGHRRADRLPRAAPDGVATDQPVGDSDYAPPRVRHATG